MKFTPKKTIVEGRKTSSHKLLKTIANSKHNWTHYAEKATTHAVQPIEVHTVGWIPTKLKTQKKRQNFSKKMEQTESS